MSGPWTPGPLKYEAGVLYVDRGIQPHVARLIEGHGDMDKWGALLAEAPAMAELLERLVGHADRVEHDYYGLQGCEGFDVEETLATVRALLARVKGAG